MVLSIFSLSLGLFVFRFTLLAALLEKDEGKDGPYSVSETVIDNVHVTAVRIGLNLSS